MSQFTRRMRHTALVAAAMLVVLQFAAPSQALQVEGSAGTMLVSNDLGPVQVDLAPSSIQTVGTTANIFSPFDITLNYVNGAPGGATQQAFDNAEAEWETVITGWKENFPGSSVTINVTLENIDNQGGILGSAGPTNGFVTANYLYTSQGSMTFDTSDIGTTLSNAAFENVVLHEMGHVLGIGTLWSASSATGGSVTGRQELYVNNSGQYTGAFGVAAYNAEFGQAGAFVPVELGGGPGTANGHWNEVNGGAGNTGIVSSIEPAPFNDFKYELMTGWLNAPTFMSSLTIDGMQDLGYDVVPEPASFALLAFGGLMIGMRKRD